MRICLPPYVSIRETGDRLRLGTMPPIAYEVEDPPEFLTDLLAELAQPLERADAVALASRRSGWSPEEAEALIADLEEAGVVGPELQRDDRYDRHRLYYRMLGVAGDPQERLRQATVGLIGMGGIGSQLAIHLAAAGVGRLIVTDGDRVELSNLTRQTLYRETDVGRLKVEAAAARLAELHSDLTVETIAQQFETPALAKAVAERADMVLLSADRPASVHAWTNSACLMVGIPFSAAGYIEGHGCVGPLLHPPTTPCYECIQVSADALPEQLLYPASVRGAAVELNPRFQAPSYGPLNGLVAAIQANEALRWLLGAPLATLGRRLLVDSRSYEVTWEDFQVTSSCRSCGRVSEEAGTWDLIAGQYQDERESHSFNSVLLDSLVPSLLPPIAGKRVADIGAGSGQITVRLSAYGAHVDAYEPAAAMRQLLEQRASAITPGLLRVLDAGLEELAQNPEAYDVIICLNVLDHLPDLPGAMRILAGALRPGGTLVVAIPHPMKDRGGWKKVPRAADWDYEHFILDDYFDEGPCRKVREDRFGSVRVRGVVTYHRTISTYLEALLATGLSITRVLEPSPRPDIAATDPVIHTKASRLPYFLVVVAQGAASA
jgi:molybdopterin/thiamine biosynthesis adenylyltransferase/SAM-dependent methyltransferase